MIKQKIKLFLYMNFFLLLYLPYIILLWCRSSRIVLLKGVDKDGFVWLVLFYKVIVIHVLCCFSPRLTFPYLAPMLTFPYLAPMLTFSYLAPMPTFPYLATVLLYAGTPIMEVERHTKYLKILMHHFFSTGMVLIDR